MRRDALPASCSVPAVALFALSFSITCAPVALLAQTNETRLQQVLASALADLENRERADDAAVRLENLGAAAVPSLSALLRWDNRDRASEAARLQAIYVLGRLGRHAVPAVPELRELVRSDGQMLGRQSMWTLSMLAPHMTPEQCEAVLVDLRTAPRSRTTQWMAAVLGNAVALAQNPNPGELLRFLDSYDSTCVAACRWLVVHPDAHQDHRERLLAALTNLLQRNSAREAVRWQANDSGLFAVGDAAEAWLAVAREPLEARTARALLNHWHKDQRRAAIAWMQENGKPLPFRERADLVSRLWDTEPALVQAAADTLGMFGRAGLVALPALRLQQEQGPEVARAACARAAERILADFAALPATDRDWLVAIDASLRGESPTAPAAPCSRTGLEAMTEVLYLAQWNRAPQLDRMLGLVELAGPCRDDTIQSVLGWLTANDTDVVDVACAWLARRGAGVRKALSAVADEPEVVLRRLIRHRVPAASAPVAIEMLAHILVADTPGRDRCHLLDDQNLRVVAHCLAASMASSPETLRPATPRLRQLLHLATGQQVVLAGPWDQGLRLDADLSAPLRTLAAVALVDLDIPFDTPAGLDDAVRGTLGVPLADLQKHVAGLRETNRLPALLDRLEERCRQALNVPGTLRWPSLAGTTR
jgi:hypothetical protein